MVAAIASASGNQGSQGLKTAAAAEQLEAVFWNMVVGAMEKTGLQGSSLGTGADLYNSVAQQALSQKLFGSLSGSLTQEIVGQLSAASAGHTAATGTVQQQTRPGNGQQPISLAGVRLAPLLLSLANAGGASGCPPVSSNTAPTVAQATAFARAIWPCLQQNAAQLNVSPVALLSQAALESGWGTAAPGNNIFGVKATAGAASTQQPTFEFSNGRMQRTTASFATYASPDEAVATYTNLIRNAYPGAVGATSVSDYATALANGGYATDPAYAQKIIEISRSPLMSEVLQSLGITEPQL